MTARFATGGWVLEDCSRTTVSLDALQGPTKARDIASILERRAEGLLDLNRGMLAELGVAGHVARRSGVPSLVLQTSTRVGAIPLRSPVTGRADYGLVVRPRFGWAGVGRAMATTGFRELPDLLPLPELPRSEREVPPWVLSSVVLARLDALLDQSRRRFELVDADLTRPRGRVDWARWSAQRLARGDALSVPCTFPDLREDADLLGLVRAALERQRQALLDVRREGVVVLRLLEWCDRLLERVAHVPSRPDRVLHRPPTPQVGLDKVFREGLDAVSWTLDERGLAGLQDLGGLAWRLSMEAFFEALVERLAEDLARKLGGRVRTGRQRSTLTPLQWQPHRGASLAHLLPDVVLELESHTVILDAKYKGHFAAMEHLGAGAWHAAQRESHRHDVHQVLAYAALHGAPRVTSVLAYPCTPEEGEELAGRGRLVRRARVATGSRDLELMLVGVPLGGELRASVGALWGALRRRS